MSPSGQVSARPEVVYRIFKIMNTVIESFKRHRDSRTR